MKPFLNIDEASELTRLNPVFIQKCCDTGSISAIKTEEGKYIVNVQSLNDLAVKLIEIHRASLPFRAMFQGNEKMNRLLDLIYGDPDEFV